MSTDPPLMILALSGRALAQSAARGGWPAIVVDGFADHDTQRAAAHCRRVAMGDHGLSTTELAAAVYELLSRGPRCSVIYGAGLEASAAVIGYCQEHAELLGNDAATVSSAQDPESFFRLLDMLGVPHPRVRQRVPAGDGWLVKSARGCGGSHVKPWRREMPTPAQPYWQRRIAGAAGSILFVGDRHRSRILGWNTLWRREPDYVYGGAVNRLCLAPTGRRTVEHAVAGLTRELGLVGLNSLDFVVTEGGPRILELNPRPSATMELYDACYRRGLVALHVAACRGTLDLDDVTGADAGPVRAHMIVYARTPVTISGGVDAWPRWCSDLPARGQTISAAAPICTVHAAGTDADKVAALARARHDALLRRLNRPRLTQAVA